MVPFVFKYSKIYHLLIISNIPYLAVNNAKYLPNNMLEDFKYTYVIVNKIFIKDKKMRESLN